MAHRLQPLALCLQCSGSPGLSYGIRYATIVFVISRRRTAEGGYAGRPRADQSWTRGKSEIHSVSDNGSNPSAINAGVGEVDGAR